ncbi:MAG TPA: hypothetical protein PLD20_27185 [Blastocatellia bacterium]|nr:hypothetical protein [Blastocatellia bacterium]HMV84730.1 hypothetical protein [Blastocatellia bacterium]HMZ21647.1 hypothetical protein [Blastocatellia bacterium]HNG30324.1 hypothetical protein [Blastocatellia bacterium]
MRRLSFGFEYDYSQVDDKVLIPVRLGLGNLLTTPLLPHLDIGSAHNIFRADLADWLNINYNATSSVIKINTAGGIPFLAYGHQVSLAVIGSSLLFETTIYFAPWPPGVGPAVGVLGLNGFDTKVRVGIVHYDRMLYLSDYNEP